MRSGIGGSIGLLAVILVACGNLGPDSPTCGFDPEDVSVEIILELQAVPTAEVGACLHDLADGWDYEPLEAERGRATFCLNSDRLGDDFLEVTLAASCDATGSLQPDQPHPGVDVFVETDIGPQPIGLTLVPVSERHRAYGASLALALDGQRLGGRDVRLGMDTGALSASDRVNAALDRENYVLVFDDRDVSNDTVELRLPDDPVAYAGLGLETAMTRIENQLADLRYRGTWYHVFEGGCITYRIDAKGPGVQSLEGDIRQVVGFYQLGELRRAGADAGFVVGFDTRLGDGER